MPESVPEIVNPETVTVLFSPTSAVSNKPEAEPVFNETVSPDMFIYEVTPQTPTEVRQGKTPYSIILSTSEVWRTGITTITILPDTTSQKNEKLKKPYVYKIKTGFPKNILQDEAY